MLAMIQSENVIPKTGVWAQRYTTWCTLPFRMQRLLSPHSLEVFRYYMEYGELELVCWQRLAVVGVLTQHC